MQQMLANLRARREDERGFTLIELMVVVLIIAILIAIAIPTFLGAKTRAQDKAAQSSLRNGLTNAKGIYTDQDTYFAATTTALNTAEPSLVFQTAASTGPKVVSVATSASGVTPSWIVMTAKAADGNCYAISDGSANGTGFKLTTGATCDAATVGTGVVATPASGSVAAANAAAWAAGW